MMVFQKTRGDSIVEVLVAITLLSSVMITTFSILNRATQTNMNVRNRIVALNIAREGMEAVRNIRDTNWLKYSGDRRTSWLCKDTSSSPEACANGNSEVLVGKSYNTVDFNSEKNRYYLNTFSTDEINISTMTPTEKDIYQLYKEDVAVGGRYTHNATGNTRTLFYRQVELEVKNPYEESPPTFCDDAVNEASCVNARLKIVVRVQWMENEALRTMVLEGNLFDFLERNGY